MLIHVPHAYVRTQVAQALEEDVGDGDITAELIPKNKQTTAEVISREEAILCGKDWFNEVFRQVDSAIEIHWKKNDGDPIQSGQVLCELSGSARSLLTGERTALNFLQTFSGTSTLTNKYVRAIKDPESATRILDTRKTSPGFRLGQKYAVHCGGGSNHRMGLYDMVLIKENHIIAAGSLKKAVEKAREYAPGFEIEVEVENIIELKQALQCGVTRILLDNMDIATLERAVEINEGRAQLEASGNITIDKVSEIAATGVHFISIGAITKHIQAVDLSMRFADL
ncbi:MAG: carboxylating nicotinate-nucleotide diphosphorylase [Gammaproteobacteria bacterium]